MSKIYKFIKTDISPNGEIITLSLNNPKKMNAVSFAFLEEIEHFVLNVVNPFSTSKARVMILKAEGKHFTAGLDLNSALDATSFPTDEDGN